MPRWYITAVISTMKKYLFVLSALVLFAFSSCKKFAGDPITKEFIIDGFYSELEVSNAFDVIVSDAVDVVTVTAGENVMPNVVVDKVGNTLKIYLKPITITGVNDMRVILPYNSDLRSVDLSGASEFHSGYGLYGLNVDVELSGASKFYCNIDAVEVDVDLSGASDFYGDILAEDIDMDLSGASNIEGALTAYNLDLDLEGASEAILVGPVDNLNIELSGASKIVRKVVGDIYALICERCEGEMSGASDAYIHCDGGRIVVNLSGASNLHYTGFADITGSTTSGGSNIIHELNP